ncbi:MAG: Flp pilus assembly protein CpaB [Rhizomicrobium sp.]
MNNSRKLILAGAGLAAIVVIFLVRGLLGGGTAPAKAALQPAVAMSNVLVAANGADSGTPLNASMVRWQAWPSSNVDASFITQQASPNIATIVSGAVVRAPLVAGQPITTANIIHSNSSGVMAATLSPGMRAVSIGISTESSAGGFILPNDRVDVILTEQMSGESRTYLSRTILKNVRVLAVDQTYKEDKDQKVVLAKTATLELEPQQAEAVERAQASGTISLSLRGLGDTGSANQAVASKSSMLGSGQGDVYILRYGIPRAGSAQKE